MGYFKRIDQPPWLQPLPLCSEPEELLPSPDDEEPPYRASVDEVLVELSCFALEGAGIFSFLQETKANAEKAIIVKRREKRFLINGVFKVKNVGVAEVVRKTIKEERYWVSALVS